MPTVLMYTSPARGHLYPMMDVVLALRDAGHRVVVQTLRDEGAHLRGVEHRPIAAEIEALTLEDHRGPTPLHQLRAATSCWAERAPHEVADLRAAVAEVRPDLLLVDANCWGASGFAETTGLPWALFQPYVLPVPSVDAPAFGPGFSPPRGWLGRLRDRLVWALQDLALRPALARCNALRAEIGARPLGRLSDVYARPDVVLYRTAPPFDDVRRDMPANVRSIGPGTWAPPGEVPEEVLALPRPRVLVSVSTELQEDGAIIDAALAALGERPGSLIVTTGALDPARFQPPHERCVIRRFLPHAALMSEFDLVITHGGMGTTQRAVCAGVPLVVVPWGRDQAESARRVEGCGAGVRLDRGRLTPARLHAAVDRALTCRARAQEVGAALGAAGGGAAAVGVLEGLLGRRGR